MRNTRLPPHLAQAQEQIENYAREYGLDFFPIIYEVLDYRTLYETAAFGGFPTRYPHWRFGMEYDQLLKGHIWQGSTIYEMVINTDPSYAYLLEGNETVTQKMVMAHVCAHVDFFKHNMWFAHTNRKMLDEMANHAARVHRIIERQGYDVVENFIDTCLSLDNLIDYHAPYIKRPDATYTEPLIETEDEETVRGLKVEREYMREYINPPDFLDRQRQQLDQERASQKKFPVSPQKDILLFLLNYAPLERWQHTILEIIRDEAYYFAPQGMTKILNEGWACVVAGTLLTTDQGLLPIEQVIETVQHTDPLHVADGQGIQPIYDWAILAERDTVYIRTRHGLELEGSTTHRLLCPDQQTWVRLDQLRVGDPVLVHGGDDLWACEYVRLAPAAAPLALAAATGAATAARATAVCVGQQVLDEALAAQWGAELQAAIPAEVLRSPRSVVLAYLRAYTATHASPTANPESLTVAALSAQDSRKLHLLLLNLGILGTRTCTDPISDQWAVTLDANAAARFAALFAANRPDRPANSGAAAVWTDVWTDEVVAIEYRRAPVYDISVRHSHRYVAQGFINHNSFWHSEIMTKRAVEPSEIISFADLHSGVVATGSGRLNPYKLGLELLRDIEERWNTGRFGKEYEECDDIAERRNWDRKLGLGRQKIFEIRKLYNDVTFIDEFLTPEFVFEQKLFTYRYNRDSDLYEIASREFHEIKQKLLFRLTNFGQPHISVMDANYNNRGELYLLHRFEGVELQMDYARETMRNLQRIWSRPVHLETTIEGRRRLLSFDGTDYHERRID